MARTLAETPHFAHHHRDACGGGPETALHKLAKQIIKERLLLFVPRRIANHGSVEQVLPGREKIQLESATLEFRDPQQIVPDLYVTLGGRKLFVEIAVTHPCGEEKIRRIRQHGVAAIEIDLWHIPRDAALEVVADAVIRSAPRKWLFNEAIDRAVVELQKEATAAMGAAANKLTADARQKARAYNIALDSMPEPLPISTIDVLRGIGLDKHIGLEVAGYGCFTTHPSLEAAIEALDNRFAAPWKAVEFYLKYLTGVGVALDWTHGFAISPAVASSWFDQVMEEMSRSSARTGIEETVRWLLDQLPDEERGGMTVEDWLNMINPETAEPYAALLASTARCNQLKLSCAPSLAFSTALALTYVNFWAFRLQTNAIVAWLLLPRRRRRRRPELPCKLRQSKSIGRKSLRSTPKRYSTTPAHG
ncbi:hypothetical protein [Mesorhizobium sp. L103C131B0]|uniref:hypothetical protein n=1 Tax=Mesorhizobium sp. L103C131B0 TaxID=1287089 RepID=UPI0012DC85DD|nr:hypothetical protein [Mesorhizobium sp. L103C131B0]